MPIVTSDVLGGKAPDAASKSIVRMKIGNETSSAFQSQSTDCRVEADLRKETEECY